MARKIYSTQKLSKDEKIITAPFKKCQMMQEFDLITKFFKPLANKTVNSDNLENDTAFIDLKQSEHLILSKDLFVEDIHFLKSDGAYKIASRLLLSNLSDLASSGAEPLYYMLGFSKTNNTDASFVKEFARGLSDIQKKYNISLIGGDTVRSNKYFFSITIFGKTKKNKFLTRNQAKKGNLIYVSGNIGDAYFGLKINQQKKLNLDKDCQYLLDRYFFPNPQINLGKELVKRNLSRCAIDISDGLLSDLNHICTNSNLTANIFLEQIPISNQLKRILNKKIDNEYLNIISAGDDYELIFVIDQKDQKKITYLADFLNIKLTNIGYFTGCNDKSSLVNLFNNNKELKKIKINKYGYEH